MGIPHLPSDTRTESPQAGIAGGAVYTRSTAVVSREIAGETIVVPICRGVGDLDSVYTFNELGSLLWQSLGKARTAEELADQVVESFEVSREQALADVQSFLHELLAVGLIHTP